MTVSDRQAPVAPSRAAPVGAANGLEACSEHGRTECCRLPACASRGGLRRPLDLCRTWAREICVSHAFVEARHSVAVVAAEEPRLLGPALAAAVCCLLRDFPPRCCRHGCVRLELAPDELLLLKRELRPGGQPPVHAPLPSGFAALVPPAPGAQPPLLQTSPQMFEACLLVASVRNGCAHDLLCWRTT